MPTNNLQVIVTTSDGLSMTHNYQIPSDANEAAELVRGIRKTIMDALSDKTNHMFLDHPFVLYRFDHVIKVQIELQGDDNLAKDLVHDRTLGFRPPSR